MLDSWNYANQIDKLGMYYHKISVTSGVEFVVSAVIAQHTPENLYI